MSISRVAALTVILVLVGMLSAIDVSHYGDCGGNATMPPEKKRWGKASPQNNEKTKWRYVYAQGRVRCRYGEKISGRVELWNDKRAEQGKEDERATFGACGPM